ncbi:hypothetical protein ACFVYG_22595 [Streptomyces sp. NPDC058256]|uniref:hypothetical protein n=1 Tax=Streptomyces sp. NPDC058256 TaxID=3346408 RepID=UPI0036EC6119
MNQYGRLAKQHWQEFRPARITEIDDPETFFTELGTDVQDEVRARWTGERVAASSVVGESYLERAGRLQQMRRDAEAEVLRELILLPADDHVDLADDPHLTDTEVAEEQWREHHLHELLAGHGLPGNFTAPERRRLRAGAPTRLLELTGLSDEALGRQGLM